jgi:hypothetical protein
MWFQPVELCCLPDQPFECCPLTSHRINLIPNTDLVPAPPAFIMDSSSLTTFIPFIRQVLANGKEVDKEEGESGRVAHFILFHLIPCMGKKMAREAAELKEQGNAYAQPSPNVCQPD